MMNNTTVTRCRNNFWLLVFLLFVLWYALLYVYDWSSANGQTPIVIKNSDSFDSSDSNPIDTSQNDTSSYGSDNVNNATLRDDEESIDEENWLENVDQISILEKELEPLIREVEAQKNDEFLCSGRYIYVHDIPSRFNNDLIKQCKLLNKWDNMCHYLVNKGLGPELGNPQRVFLPSGWFNTHQFSLEVIFHNRMKQYDCLTNDSAKAAAVFVPYYAGLDVARYLWGHHNKSEKDSDSLALAKWLRGKREWEVMGGRDHFVVAGRITWDFRRGDEEDANWGNQFMLLPEFKNASILTIESSPWNRNDFGIPYPTYFHPSSDEEVTSWQNKMRRQRRRILFSFVGGPRPQIEDSIRGEIIDQCAAAKRKCRFLECKNDGTNKCQKPIYVMRIFQGSTFCLQPPGDSFTRRSTFDSILAGCIPVFFSPGSAYVQYLWHLPSDYTKYSVLIPEDDVKDKKASIERALSRISRQKVADMREEVIRLIPKVVYADPRSKLKEFEDAFDLTLKGVLERVETIRREIKEGTNTSTNFDEEYSWKYNTFGTLRKHEWDHFFRRSSKGY